MGGLIQFRFGDNGEMDLVVDKAVWEVLAAAVSAAGAGGGGRSAAVSTAAAVGNEPPAGPPTEVGGFVCIPLSRVTAQNLVAVAAMPKTDEPPCQPVVQITIRS